MDTYLLAARSHLQLTEKVLQARLDKLESQTTKLSRHYSRVAHARAMLSLVQELSGIIYQDPDEWDDEPDLVPF